MHVGRLEQYHNTNILATHYVGTKLNKLDDSKNFHLEKRRIGIEGEKIMETS